MKASILNKLHQDSDLCQVNICVNFIAQSIWEVRHRYIGHSTLGLVLCYAVYPYLKHFCLSVCTDRAHSRSFPTDF